MKVGIVGHEAAKFTPAGEQAARDEITRLLTVPGVTHVVSGHCHLGGIDVWAEEIGIGLGLEPLIFPPRSHDWSRGYKPRNIQIAEASDLVAVLVVDRLPPTYEGMRFSHCYHCGTDDHVKSGGCWTARYALRRGKSAVWYRVLNGPSASEY